MVQWAHAGTPAAVVGSVKYRKGLSSGTIVIIVVVNER